MKNARTQQKSTKLNSDFNSYKHTNHKVKPCGITFLCNYLYSWPQSHAKAFSNFVKL